MANALKPTGGTRPRRATRPWPRWSPIGHIGWLITGYSPDPGIRRQQLARGDGGGRRRVDLSSLGPGEVTTSGLREAVNEVCVDPRVRAGLAAMRDHARWAGGAVAAADALETHVS